MTTIAIPRPRLTITAFDPPTHKGPDRVARKLTVALRSALAEIARLRALGLEACDVAIDSAPVATPTRIEEIRKELTRG